MDRETRELILESEANALFEKLRVFSSSDKLFALAEIMHRVQRRLKSQRSNREKL